MQADRASPSLGESMQEWLDSLRELDVRALVVLGPASADDVQGRALWAAHPASYRASGEAFAAADVYGSAWRATASPAMAWQNIPDEDAAGWMVTLADQKIRAIVRTDIAMPFGAGFECVAFAGRHLGRYEAFEIGWALANAWPTLKDDVIATRFGLTPRMREVLRVLAEGLTAEAAAQRLGMKERTVGYHLNVVMERLNARNRAAAILRACILGIL
jgi:DNA-binding CsgD family transcriptional regulator